MNGEFNPEGKFIFSLVYHYFILYSDELENALDEIKKIEKETGMIAMVAQTLFEQTGE